MILSGTGILAILMGLFAPRHPLLVPGWAYMLLPIIMPLWGVVRGRQLKQLELKAREPVA